MTPSAPKHSISPESSDGFASVGTILPKEKAAPLPGGLFMSFRCQFSSNCVVRLSAISTIENSRMSGMEWPLCRPSHALCCFGVALLHRVRTLESRESKADVAQLVEQLIRNQQVIGSSPIVGSNGQSHLSVRCALVEPYSYRIIHGNLHLSSCLHSRSIR